LLARLQDGGGDIPGRASCRRTVSDDSNTRKSITDRKPLRCVDSLPHRLVQQSGIHLWTLPIRLRICGDIFPGGAVYRGTALAGCGAVTTSRLPAKTGESSRKSLRA